QFASANRDDQAHAYRCGCCILIAPFLLRRFYLEGARKLDPAIAWFEWRHSGNCAARNFSWLAFARREMGHGVRCPARSVVAGTGAEFGGGVGAHPWCAASIVRTAGPS